MKGADFFTMIASRPPMTRVHPRVAAFLREYLSGEKAVRFRGQWVVNTHFPPWPGRAFDRLAESFMEPDDAGRLYSVTLAVTNRCSFNCWHCYNAGRSTRDTPLDVLRALAAELQQRGAALITLTGGEPLLREDLPAIAAAFDDRSCVNVGTTGWGLDDGLAVALRDAGVFAVGVSLDSADGSEHDRLRNRPGAWRAALAALRTCDLAGLYPYVVAVATREFLQPDHFHRFMRLAQEAGAREVHLLEPCATGRLAGRGDVVLAAEERRRLLEYQRWAAARDDLPVVSTFAYLESADAFGCGAGLTHIYIDGAGEVCPCNLVPLSFGNICREPLDTALRRMGEFFRRPRPACVGRLLSPHAEGGTLPTQPSRSCEICREHLPREHPLPRFFQVRASAVESAGRPELMDAYDRVGGDYDARWLSAAAEPVRQLVARLDIRGDERLFEAGCGTGFASALVARRLNRGGRLLAVDISSGMLAVARQRLALEGVECVDLAQADALEVLSRQSGLDGIVSTWVLGYIPLATFFSAAAGALRPGGWLAFIVHTDRSPRRETDIFARLVAEDPTVLTRRVAFDFPRDAEHLRQLMEAAGLVPREIWRGAACFLCATAEEVLEHLLWSGAGTVFHDAIDPARRPALTERFVDMLRRENDRPDGFEVRHDYLACICRK